MLHHSAFQDQRHTATAHLAQTMTFLQMSTTELETALLKELNENPALELVEELRCPQCGKRLARLPCPTCAAPRTDDQPVVYLSPRQSLGDRSRADNGESSDDIEVRLRERLDEYILRQIAPALEVAERPVAAYLLAQLDEDGLLTEPIIEMAQYLRVAPSRIERVLNLIQHSDPPGVGAQSPQQSLLIQLESLAETTPEALLTIARAIITEHFEPLARRDYARIARALQIPLIRVTQAAQFIQRNLTPYPGRAYWGEGKQPYADEVTYKDPDISITQLRKQPNGSQASGSLMVEIIAPLSGWLRVNPELKAALAQCPEEGEREKWVQAVERAGLIAKCLQQRNHTLRRLMEMIATEQRAFILGGDGDLRPFTRSRVAKELGVHESTISRAVAGKSIALPNGRIVPLSKFFDRSLSVRDRVRNIIEAENRPLTDDEIAARLADDGLQVARRTVAKYRNMLGILPANLRGAAKGNGRANDHLPMPMPVAQAPIAIMP
ncbi:MAG: RNA polymerase factor sigma-54 [Anaerolineales bacterium]